MKNLWYLSPSDQTDNTGINGYGTEEAQMNALLDVITPHLDRCGVRYHRASRDLGIDYRPAESDRLGADYYLALHSNAGGGGAAYGPIAFYYAAGKELAEELVAQLRATGQKSNRYQSVVQNQNLYETRMMKATSCLLEVDFHDSAEGVNFIVGRRADAARAVAKAICKIDGTAWVEESAAPVEPEVPDMPPEAPSETVYVVKYGDTLSGIASEYGTTYQALAAYNGIANPNIIHVGDKIRIPGTAEAPAKSIEDLAREVIRGEWGNGAERRERLTAAGYDYDAVQTRVNTLLG